MVASQRNRLSRRAGADTGRGPEYDRGSTTSQEGLTVSDLHIPIPGVGVGAGGISINVPGGDLGIPITPDQDNETEGEIELEIGD